VNDPSSGPLAFDAFVIDFAGRRLLRDGQPLALEPKAFAVLALLATAPGRAGPWRATRSWTQCGDTATSPRES